MSPTTWYQVGDSDSGVQSMNIKCTGQYSLVDMTMRSWSRASSLGFLGRREVRNCLMWVGMLGDVDVVLRKMVGMWWISRRVLIVVISVGLMLPLFVYVRKYDTIRQNRVFILLVSYNSKMNETPRRAFQSKASPIPMA